MRYYGYLGGLLFSFLFHTLFLALKRSMQFILPNLFVSTIFQNITNISNPKYKTSTHFISKQLVFAFQ